VNDDDYQRDYNAGLNDSVGNVGSPGYAAGEAARGRAEERSRKIDAASQQMAIEIRRNPVKFYARSLVQAISAAVVVGLIAGGWAVLNQRPPLELAVPAAAVTLALFAIVLVVWSLGYALGLLYMVVMTLVALPFVLWRWLLAFGAIGAGAGFALATSANQTSALAQQKALDFGLTGLVVGFAIGAIYRLLLGLRRRGRERVAPAIRR
jgi:hypothetical protein